MQRLLLAVRLFFAVLFGGVQVSRAQMLLEGGATEEAAPEKPKSKPKRPEPPPKPTRSEALTLLASLQREARFLDIVSEPLAEYSDEQVGAAARDVLRGCGEVVERMFALKPVLSEDEGSQVDVPVGYDPAEYRLTGNVRGEPPFQGSLVHHGWQAERCELPAWTGSERSARIIAAAEINVP